MGDFGDFEEVKEEGREGSSEQTEQHQFPVRVRMPGRGQFIGVVLERLGGKRMSVKTTDGKVRNCRVPGRFRRKFWLRPGNYVIIEPWPDDNEKGDIVFQYNSGGELQLKKKGLVNNLVGEF